MKSLPLLLKCEFYKILILVFYCSFINSQIIFRDETLVENSPCKTSDNLWGVCTRSSRCSKLKFQNSMLNICAFDGDEAIICCVRSSELACNGFEILKGKLFKPPPRSFFIGGYRAKPREHPHMAAIGWTQDSYVNWKCGGSLISEKYLITAAHCTSVQGIRPDIVRAGVTNLLTEDPDLVPLDYNITEIIVHPEYKSSATYHDIALIQMEPISRFFDPNMPKPICIWPNEVIPTADLLAMGFGTLSFGGPQSNELFVGTLKHVQQDVCIAAFASNSGRRLSKGIIAGQMCAQDPRGTKDTCQGDSGGPLQFTDNNGTLKVNFIVGITSFGEGCLGPTPGVYTRLHTYLNWIENIVWPHFK